MKKKKVIIITIICLLLGIVIGGVTSYMIGKCHNDPCNTTDELNDVINYSCELEVDKSKVSCELQNFFDKEVSIKSVTLKASGDEMEEQIKTVDAKALLKKDETRKVEFNLKDVDKITKMELTYEYEK